MKINIISKTPYIIYGNLKRISGKEVADRWLKNYSNMDNRIYKEKLEKANQFEVIVSSFDWKNTPEGGEYWYKIHETYRKYL